MYNEYSLYVLQSQVSLPMTEMPVVPTAFPSGTASHIQHIAYSLTALHRQHTHRHTHTHTHTHTHLTCHTPTHSHTYSSRPTRSFPSTHSIVDCALFSLSKLSPSPCVTRVTETGAMSGKVCKVQEVKIQTTEFCSFSVSFQ
eukprot:Gregarina_sp_Pseudo_9__5496@NODE_708_length_2328_cov_188_910004_g271_i1_p2_GENE_NODE_708_length_2328_cov_188_910004_g271_i1NODE_708_length_2328_cov_188_910004_g271_i1_p2_ORF_typecomplete_len142_score12_66Drc1Sld2/PF11719_8/0_039LIM_bind/PF01803_16/0_069_NODE_708_length_2328_cov_188_910004_g271_i118262251